MRIKIVETCVGSIGGRMFVIIIIHIFSLYTDLIEPTNILFDVLETVTA